MADIADGVASDARNWMAVTQDSDNLWKFDVTLIVIDKENPYVHSNGKGRTLTLTTTPRN